MNRQLTKNFFADNEDERGRERSNVVAMCSLQQVWVLRIFRNIDVKIQVLFVGQFPLTSESPCLAHCSWGVG